MDERSTKKMIGLHPVLVRKLTRVLEAMAALGFPMTVTDGVRTLEQQQALYAIGRTKPGKIVTKADGITNKSNHQTKDDGFGHAADATFLDENGQPTWSGDDLPWATYGACAKAVGLRWGGDWTGFSDRPHIELPRVV